MGITSNWNCAPKCASKLLQFAVRRRKFWGGSLSSETLKTSSKCSRVLKTRHELQAKLALRHESSLGHGNYWVPGETWEVFFLPDLFTGGCHERFAGNQDFAGGPWLFWAWYQPWSSGWLEISACIMRLPKFLHWWSLMAVLFFSFKNADFDWNLLWVLGPLLAHVFFSH